VFSWHGISLVVLSIVHWEIFVFVEFITVIMLLYGHTQSADVETGFYFLNLKKRQASIIQGRRNDPQRLEKRESRVGENGLRKLCPRPARLTISAHVRLQLRGGVFAVLV
jgi:hypothetical protein